MEEGRNPVRVEVNYHCTVIDEDNTRGCNKYRGTWLLSVLLIILTKWKPFVENIVGEYQAESRAGKLHYEADLVEVL